MNATEKAPDAFRTIGEVAANLGVPQHILRFWESKFPQLRPLKRNGNRRYYRPEDVALVQWIDQLLNQQGYTIAGAQKLVKQQQRGGDGAAGAPTIASTTAKSAHVDAIAPDSLSGDSRFDRAALQTIRDMLADALERTRAA